MLFFQVIGLPLLLCFAFIATFLTSLPWKKYFTANKSNCFKKILFHEIVLEEGETLVRKTLRDTAIDKLTGKLNTCVTKKQWGKYLDVPEEVITELSLE